MGALGLMPLLNQSGLLASDSPLYARAAHFPAKAKRVIHIFPQGGPSQVDTFDPKPALEKYHNRQVDEVLKGGSERAFSQAGRHGGRAVHCPVHAHQKQRSRTGPAHDELRRIGERAPQPSLLGGVRTGY